MPGHLPCFPRWITTPTASRRRFAPDQNNGTMRSSKSRSRNKSRNPRSLGNVVNRVFDSSGPEGKVRGTPQQIIEKYLALARDAQLSNDRVAEQSYLQHAEHYTRMLGEAQREQAERQAQFGGTGDDREDRGQGQNQGGQNHQGHSQNGQNQGGQPWQNQSDNRREDRDTRQDRDNRRDDRQDRGERRDDRQDRGHDRGQDRGQQDRRRDDRAAQPLTTEAHEELDTLPDFVRAAPRGIPEALPVDRDETGPVEMPERRQPEAVSADLTAHDLTAHDPAPHDPAAQDMAAPDTGAADEPVVATADAASADEPPAAGTARTRKPRAASATPRRAAPRKRTAETEAAPDAPAD